MQQHWFTAILCSGSPGYRRCTALAHGVCKKFGRSTEVFGLSGRHALLELRLTFRPHRQDMWIVWVILNLFSRNESDVLTQRTRYLHILLLLPLQDSHICSHQVPLQCSMYLHLGKEFLPNKYLSAHSQSNHQRQCTHQDRLCCTLKKRKDIFKLIK